MAVFWSAGEGEVKRAQVMLTSVGTLSAGEGVWEAFWSGCAQPVRARAQALTQLRRRSEVFPKRIVLL